MIQPGKLTAIAERTGNQRAADEWRDADEDEGVVARSTAWVGDTISTASKQLAGSARRAAASVGLVKPRSRRKPHKA